MLSRLSRWICHEMQGEASIEVLMAPNFSCFFQGHVKPSYRIDDKSAAIAVTASFVVSDTI